MKKYMWKFYNFMIGSVSHTGLTKILPLSWRRRIGNLLRKSIRVLTPVDTSKPHEILGHKMFLHPVINETIQAMVFGTYETETVEIFSKIVKPGMTVVDVGAYIGFYTLLAAKHVGPNGKVYAFEPQPEIQSILLKNIMLNGYDSIVSIIPKAVSNRSGSVELFLSKNDSAESSFYADDHIGNTSVVVEAITLDEFFAGERWPDVHLVKMDIEGAEKQALEGMKELVRRNPNLKLIIEFNPIVQKKAGVAPKELFEVLLSLGFQKFSVIKGGLQPIHIPEEIPRLIHMTEGRFVNILCER